MPTEATTDSQLTIVLASKAGRSKHGAGEQAGESRMYVSTGRSHSVGELWQWQWQHGATPYASTYSKDTVQVALWKPCS